MKEIPPSVQRARLELDFTELSKLGKKGVKAKRRKERLSLQKLLAEVEEKLRQANEDICPVD